MSGINFFDHDANQGYDFSALEVYINDELTNIPANSLNANAGDDIRIVSRSKPYPFFRPSNGYPDYKDYIASIEEPLPFMGETDFSYYFAGCSTLTFIPFGLFDNNPNVTDFNACFTNCTSLTSIPDGLFDNNPNVTDFSSCFNGCSALTSIPEGLFDNNTDITEFGHCFNSCRSLTSIPLGLFNKNTKVTGFYFCFYNCRNLTVNVQIGSTTTDYVNVDMFADDTAAKGTVYCRAGSSAYNNFLRGYNTNVNVLTY